MDRLLRTTATLTLMALVFHASAPAWAATGATIEGTVDVPCDPSRIEEVTSIRILPESGRPAATLAVDPSTGKFSGPELSEGRYALTALGADGMPLSSEPRGLVLARGSNAVVLSLQPPACRNLGANADSGSQAKPSKKKAGKKGLRDWQLTLIYFGVIGAIILILDDDDDDEPRASPSNP